MLYFVLRVLVNALAVAITFALLPGIHVSPIRGEPIAVTYISVGITLGILNAVLRPLLTFLTARLLLWSMGLFVFVINIVLFFLVGLTAPAVIQFDSPEIVWLLLGGTVMLLLVIVGESLFALNSPVFDSNNRSKFYWRWLAKLPSGRRNTLTENLRVYFLLRILLSYTEEFAIGWTPAASFRAFMQRLIYGDREIPGGKSVPAKVRVLLQDLGPTFVKFGQMVSSRADDLPPEWRDELAKLQSNVPPFPYEEAKQIITTDLHAPPEMLFSSIEHKPFAAASTAQVHRATLHDGTVVVVKVQRPDIDVTVKADLNVMRDVADIIQRRQEWARDVDLKGLLNEFADNVLLELNYVNEAYNARVLAYNMASLPSVHVPIIYPELCSKRVLTQEYVKGVKITAVEKLEAAGIDRAVVARDFLRAMLKQVLFDGFFHADPHPGNILVDLQTSQIIFLDMGLMGSLSQEQRLALSDVIWCLRERDGQGLAKTVIQLSTKFKPVNERAFAGEVDRIMKRYAMFADGQMNLSAPIQDLMDTMNHAGLRLDSSLTLALKALFQAEEVVSTLDPNLPLIVVAFQDLKELFAAQLNPENVKEAVRTQTMRAAKEVVRRIPNLAEASVKWLDQYQQGRFNVHLDTTQIDEQIEKVNRNISRSVTLLALLLLVAGLLVGSAIASTSDAKWGSLALADIAFFIFVAGAVTAAVFGVRVGWRMWTGLSAEQE